MKLCPLGGFSFTTVLVLRKAYAETDWVSIKECVANDSGKKRKEARLCRGDAQLDIDLMAILVDLRGSSGTKNDLPELSCVGLLWRALYLHLSVTGYRLL